MEKFNFSQFKTNGLPLKYPLTTVEQDLYQYLEKCDIAEQKMLQKDFNISFVSSDGFKRLVDIPNLNIGAKTQKHQDIIDIITRYTTQNEVMVSDPAIKEGIEELIRAIPEYTFIIGKQQNNAHSYSVDIHTLINLQKALKYAKDTKDLVSKVKPEQMEILKLSILLHDVGKKFLGYSCSDTGHAKLSKEYAKKMLEVYPGTRETKSRILNLIENHHWFKDFNLKKISSSDVVDTFGDDLNLAMIMAKSDLESVSNSFHLRIVKPGKKLSQVEYKKIMDEIFSGLQKLTL